MSQMSRKFEYAVLIGRFQPVHFGHQRLIEHCLRVAERVIALCLLAGLLGLPIRQARQVMLDNCGVSVVTSEGGLTTLTTLNAAFHLPAAA